MDPHTNSWNWGYKWCLWRFLHCAIDFSPYRLCKLALVLNQQQKQIVVKVYLLFGTSFYYTVKILNIRTPQKICCNHPKIWTRWLYQRVMHPKDAVGIANSVDPDQTAPRRSDCSSRSSLIWVCTVCPDLSVRKLRIITVHSVKRLELFPLAFSTISRGYHTGLLSTRSSSEIWFLVGPTIAAAILER